MLFAVPPAIAAALFTAAFAPGGVREVIKPVVELLAGFPSVVLGFFALIVLASGLQDLFDFDYRLNAVNAGLALGLLGAGRDARGDHAACSAPGGPAGDLRGHRLGLRACDQ